MRREPLPILAGGESPRRTGSFRYLLLVVGVVLAGVAGYVGYLVYPRFALPSVVGVGLLLLAAGAGVAAFFSPCAFPLLLILLGRQIGAGANRRARTRTALVFASSFSVGAVAFVLGLGALIGLGGRELVSSVTFTSPAGIGIRITVGLLLVTLGLIQAEAVSLSFHGIERVTGRMREAEARLRREHPVAGFGLFGFSYLIFGFG